MKRRSYTSLADYFKRGPETQTQLGRRIGVSQTTISLAKNYGKGSYRTLSKIAEATGVPLESFQQEVA